MLQEENGIAGRVIKMTIAACYYVCLEAWFALLRRCGRPARQYVTVIYYHHVPNCLRARFVRQLEHLAKFAIPVSTELRSLPPSEVRYVALTADDGWHSFFRNALPELLRRQIPVTIFIVSGRLGESIDGKNDDRLITADELVTISAPLITIGAHTISHCRLTEVDESTARIELAGSRAALAKLLGREVDLFCFPYGAFDRRALELCRESGYRVLFTCLPERSDWQHNDSAIVGRVRVDPTDWPLEFHLKICGAYAWLSAAILLKAKLRRLVRSLLRQCLHSLALTTS